MSVRFHHPVITFLVASVSLELAGCVAGDRAELNRLRRVDFQRVTSASVATIVDPTKHRVSGQAFGGFHGFILVTPWREIAPETSDRLSALLRQPLEDLIKAYASAGPGEVVRLSSFCLPDPGFAVHLETAAGPRDFAICLRCDDVEIYAPGGATESYSLDDAPLKELNARYRTEFR